MSPLVPPAERLVPKLAQKFRSLRELARPRSQSELDWWSYRTAWPR